MSSPEQHVGQELTTRTHNSEVVYLTLKLQIHATHKSNIYIITIGVWETSIKTKIIVSSTNATQWYCLDNLICQNLIIIKFKL